MSENGKVTTEVAEQAVQAVAEGAAPARLWLHPDALKPRDYLRGKVALAGVLEERKYTSCYDFLGTDEMYPFLIWALRSRDDPSFGWEEALDTPFYEFETGDDARPQTQLPVPSGSSESMPSGSGSTRRRPRPAAVPSSASSSD